MGGVGRFAFHPSRRNVVMDVDLVGREAQFEHLYHGCLILSLAARGEKPSVAIAPILVVPEMTVDDVPGFAHLFQVALPWFIDKMPARYQTQLGPGLEELVPQFLPVVGIFGAGLP